MDWDWLVNAVELGLKRVGGVGILIVLRLLDNLGTEIVTFNESDVTDAEGILSDLDSSPKVN